MSMAAQPDPDLRADVDFMVLDYLACLAIERALAAAEVPSPNTGLEDEVNWMVEPVKAFRAVMATAQPETPLPLDLDIKLRILTVAYQLWNYTLPPATSRAGGDANPRLASIGIEFMDMCAVAVSKVSETRWFDTGARFMTQAVLEEQRDRTARPEALDRFNAWKPSGPERNMKWSSALERYAAELPASAGVPAAWETLQQMYPFAEFKAIVVAFLFELMTTLDPPVLIQLEQGKLGSLTTAETQQLKKRVGIR